jgi:geranylgeranyl diphosphate synthase type II
MDIKAYLEDKRSIINKYLNSYFSTSFLPSLLYESITYSLLSDGKRIRPILAIASFEACGGLGDNILPQAVAIELIHAYSLIHDDLPSMDNDDLRRGRPTNHKVFGEAMAILAGDALLTEAFFMMTEMKAHDARFKRHHTTEAYSIHQKHEQRNSSPITYRLLVKAMREVACAAGIHGMVGGQAQDILSEDAEPDRETLDFIHSHKTAALIRASVRIGPILADSGIRKMRALTCYGENIGLAFQIVDDILDIEGTTLELGKPVGSDAKKKKMTYPLLYGIDVARQKKDDCLADALEALKAFGPEADPLREIARYLVVRRR